MVPRHGLRGRAGRLPAPVLPTTTHAPALRRFTSSRIQWKKDTSLRNSIRPFAPRSSHATTPKSKTNDLETADAIFRSRKTSLLACGIVALGMGVYVSTMLTSCWLSSGRQGPEPATDACAPGQIAVFTEESARRFDEYLDGSEWMMGITSLRQKLAAEASGHVVEVAMGTGRNLPFYNWSHVVQQPKSATTNDQKKGITTPAPILSFTGVDISKEMLTVALDKVSEAVPDLKGVAPSIETQQLTQDGYSVFSYLSGRLRFFRSDVHMFVPAPIQGTAETAKYDTVVQTFGLCSVRDPEKVIRTLAGIVKPNTGKIILVEHGRGSCGIVNGLLDRSAPAHFQKYGCWWNRDIAEIVHNAAQSTPGLEVVKIERPYLTQLGTTLWIELRVKNTC
ncbi:Methyltransferase OMS1 [Colletotrichum siamense]|uniref:Methyltransferase OMS1 n=1 Tax=Colletotrichum siamense TaxID=690259 RepID=A0A9P5EIC0_COLSI|nr:Methyltransferase OMS1 [Colletotrichum siamense]KAF4845650.1 Methyltransferase OMS1 [Colletotrichum siamense]